MLDQVTVCQEMAIVRNRGLVNAVDLGHEVERLSDWREHVRAHPIPVAVLAGALGYWLVPTRPNGTGARGPTAASSAPSSDGSGAVSDEQSRTAGIAGLGGAAMGFVGSLIGNAVRGYVAEQIQSLIHTRGSNALPNQRQASSARD